MIRKNSINKIIALLPIFVLAIGCSKQKNVVDSNILPIKDNGKISIPDFGNLEKSILKEEVMKQRNFWLHRMDEILKQNKAILSVKQIENIEQLKVIVQKHFTNEGIFPIDNLEAKKIKEDLKLVFSSDQIFQIAYSASNNVLLEKSEPTAAEEVAPVLFCDCSGDEDCPRKRFFLPLRFCMLSPQSCSQIPVGCGILYLQQCNGFCTDYQHW